MYDVYGCIDIGEYCWIYKVVFFVIVLVICVFSNYFCVFFNCIIYLVDDFFEVLFVDNWVDIDVFFKFIFDFQFRYLFVQFCSKFIFNGFMNDQVVGIYVGLVGVLVFGCYCLFNGKVNVCIFIYDQWGVFVEFY